MEPYVLIIYSTLSLGLVPTDKHKSTCCRITCVDSLSLAPQGEAVDSELVRYNFQVNWRVACYLVRPHVKKLRVDVFDADEWGREVQARGSAFIDLSKKPDNWNRAPIYPTGSKEVSGEIEYGIAHVDDPKKLYLDISQKKELYSRLSPYLSESDRFNFYGSKTPQEELKIPVLELYVHIESNYLPPLNSPAWKAFGFQNCTVQEERNLLGLYIGLVKGAFTTVEEFTEAWQADDLLGLIDRKYEEFPKRGLSKGWYYSEWLLKNKDKIGRYKGCKVCGSLENTKRCTGCSKVYYCGKKHQQEDWKSHKVFCKNEQKSPNICPGENHDYNTMRKQRTTLGK